MPVATLLGGWIGASWLGFYGAVLGFFGGIAVVAIATGLVTLVAMFLERRASRKRS